MNTLRRSTNRRSVRSPGLRSSKDRALLRRQTPLTGLIEFQAHLLQRYPIGLLSAAEVEALLDSWLR